MLSICKKRKNVSRVLAIIMIMIMVASAIFSSPVNVYAKDVGNKNEQACDHCKMVVKGETPTDTNGKPYDKLLNGAVYRGGNARSVVSENNVDYELDKDPNDFANPLPYGNVYVDTSRLDWSDSNKNNFIIDIKDNRFKWVAVDGKQFEDANGFTTTNDPLESGKALAGRTPKGGGGLDKGAIDGGFIAYVAN